MSDGRDVRLCRLARAVLQLGFEGTRAPEWVLRRLAEGGDVTRIEAATDSTTDLLREKLGFSGLLVADAMEMRAVADRYGLERAVVMAVAAGADLVCIGHAASDELVGRLQATLVNAVEDGELAEERLTEAAGRVAEFAAWKGTDAC